MNDNPYVGYSAQELKLMEMNLELELGNNRVAAQHLEEIKQRLLAERTLIHEALIFAAT